MPELPEVEIVTRNLNQIVKPFEKVVEIKFYRKNLRNIIPVKAIQKLAGMQIKRIYRRAKFIIFEFAEGSIISHLGMTGYWRIEQLGWIKKKHDHISIQLEAGRFLVYNDARRFGEFDYFLASEVGLRFKNFGPEPLAVDTDFEKLTADFKKLKTVIKVALMNQKNIVGVGNIYASEALFQAKIKPTRIASRITKVEYAKLWTEVQKVLDKAILAGGSSIQSYQNSYGEKGSFQFQFAVYDRVNQACLFCGAKIKNLYLGGRSSFWCSCCQK